MDPTDPSIAYLGGFGGNNYNSDTGLIRVDATDINDAHRWFPCSIRRRATIAWICSREPVDEATTFDSILGGPPVWESPDGQFITTPYLNFIRDPDEPFLNDAALYVYNYASFTNNGGNSTWVPFDMPGTAYQAAVAETDPATGCRG